MKTFSERCYERLLEVPVGKVTTYAELASAIGSRAPRAVGQAMHRNKDAPRIPCHRVVASDGSLHGYALGLSRKQQLLEAEGVSIIDGRVDLARHLHKFNPHQ